MPYSNVLGIILILLSFIGFMYLLHKTLEPNKKYDQIRKDIAKYLKKHPERKPLRSCTRR